MKLTKKDKERYFIPSLKHDMIEILRKINDLGEIYNV